MRKGHIRDGGRKRAPGADRASDTVPSAAPHQTQQATRRRAARDELSSPRARVPDIVPTGWLDRLLMASLDLPLSSGARAVVEGMVDALAAILPTYAIGVCFVPEPGAVQTEQFVVMRLPDGGIQSTVGIDPTRLFPGLSHEHVASIEEGVSGSTLHLASEDDALERSSSPAVHLVDRAAMVLGRALAHVRYIEPLRGAQNEARALEERMVQADKLASFGQIAAGVVHELNNPLTSIVAYSDYLIRKALALDASADMEDVERLRRISESANRMLRFTRDLVSYARPSNGVPGPVVLHGVIDQAIAFCEHVLSAAGVRIERRYGVDVRTVRGISEQLVQVFINLLTNASQAASAKGGCVVVKTSLEDGRIAVWVEDDGSGIAPEHLARVFAPFFTTKGERQGTGLGLSIVKRIVENHDGEIRAESEPGRGTRFVIVLPAMQRG